MPALMDDKLRSVLRRIYECHAFKFGEFKLKSGDISPVYVDLRIVVSQPDLMVDMCGQFNRLASKCTFDFICGVPYTGLTMATCLSTQHNLPMVMRRKEVKDYGTRQTIEGIYQSGQTALIIEDVMTSGTSILETVQVLRSLGIKVTDALIFIDREQGGIPNMAKYGINVHTVITISEMLKFLAEEGHLTKGQVSESLDWLHKTHVSIPAITDNQLSLLAKSKNTGLAERAGLCLHPLSKSLFELMNKKQSNLCVAADMVRAEDILKLATTIGPYIVMLKTHIDIIEDFTPEFIAKLRKYSNQYDFLLFEDRKFADIGSTVAKQYSSGLYRIRDWADIVNAHIMPGPSLITSLKSEAAKAESPRACLLLAHMSSENNLFPKSYGDEAFKIADTNRDFVIGFISQKKVTNDPTLIHFTPGVRIAQSGDGQGQTYVTPEVAIGEHGADIIIVGRGIVSYLNGPSEQLVETTKEYQRRGFEAYLQSL